MATKKKTSRLMESLIGKPVMVKNRYETTATGPYTFLGADAPFLAVYDTQRNKTFWWNARLVDCIAEGECEIQSSSLES